MSRRFAVPSLVLAVALAPAILLFACAADDSVASASSAPSPNYDDAFWKHWGDGRAELSGYELSYERYGERREGTAVAIFVTETLAETPRVKSENPDRPQSETFPVIKLNLVQDFPTGVYDYSLMTSAFVALAEHGGRPRGAATKVSFSAQEWCGHVYAQLVFDAQRVALDSHSYFDGEADERLELDASAGGVAEDALPIWARGLAAPRLEPGESREVPLLRSLEIARLGHVAVNWDRATLSRSAAHHTVEVPAGTFEVETVTVEVAAAAVPGRYPPGRADERRVDRRWTFLVETAAPHRIVEWQRDDAVRARLLASERMPYWQMNGGDQTGALERLGLTARPPRTP